MADQSAVFDQLVRLQIELWNGVDDRLKKEHDLPVGRFTFLRIIDERGGCRVNDIADDMLITIGGTSKIVDRLEQSGLVARRANPDDRRSSMIELTTAGRDLLADATVTFDDELARRMPLPKRELDALFSALTDLRGGGEK